MVEWMNEWMIGMDEWMNGWLEMNKWMNLCISDWNLIGYNHDTHKHRLFNYTVFIIKLKNINDKTNNFVIKPIVVRI